MQILTVAIFDKRLLNSPFLFAKVKAMLTSLVAITSTESLSTQIHKIEYEDISLELYESPSFCLEHQKTQLHALNIIAL